MICPQCGYDMGNRNKCYRCGYEVKTLAVVDEQKNDQSSTNPDREETETKVIDPCNVYLTHPYGVDEDIFGASRDPFSSIFDELFGDPISDLLGGLFGINLNPRRTVVADDPPPQKTKKKQGPVIVVDDIEIIPADESSNRPDTESEPQKSSHDPQTSNKQKNAKRRFRRGK